MSSVKNDTADDGPFIANGGFDVSGESTLIQPEKRILLNIGEQSNYTILPALREDVYTISSVGNVNGLFAGFPVPHTWNYDVSGDRHIEVDAWQDSAVGATSNSATLASDYVRDKLFNQFKTGTQSNMIDHVIGSAHSEMTLDTSKTYSLVDVGQKDRLGQMQTYGDSSGMLSTTSFFNEYLTDDGLITGSPLDYSAGNLNPSGSTNGTMFGQLQEALVSWFEAASYKDTTVNPAGETVDPRQHDILRSWMYRDTIDKRHLAKMNESMIKKLLSKENANSPGSVDNDAANTLAYCCFDADQIKQIFSTVEMTGRIREEKAQQFIPVYEKEEDGTTASTTVCADGQIGGQTAPVDYAGNTLKVPRHKLALRHGEGFAIVVPAKTRLRSGTISEANLLVRLFQSHAGAVVE